MLTKLTKKHARFSVKNRIGRPNRRFKRKYKPKKWKYKVWVKPKVYRLKLKVQRSKHSIIRVWNRKLRKMVLRKRRKKYFKWVKKKVETRRRNLQNALFFFNRKLRPRTNRINHFFLNYLRYNLKLAPKRILWRVKNRYKGVWKMRRPRKAQHTLKKKLALKALLKRHYRLKNETSFKFVKQKVKRKLNRVKALFFFFESQLATICLRMHFFWTLRKACRWVPFSVVAVNNLAINRIRHRVNVHDFIKIIGPRALWRGRFIKEWGLENVHFKIYQAINYTEVSPATLAGIVVRIPIKTSDIRFLRRRSKYRWIRRKTFAYLANSFY